MIIGTAVLTIFVRRFISKPVGAMAGAAAELSKGNLKVELQYKSGDELGFLSDALRTTILSLQGYIHDISDKLRQMASGNMCITIDHEYVGILLPSSKLSNISWPL
jgi:methyl-accepting chemotaxis protein